MSCPAAGAAVRALEAVAEDDSRDALFTVTHGNPTAEELAALTVVLTAAQARDDAAGGRPQGRQPQPREAHARNRWPREAAGGLVGRRAGWRRGREGLRYGRGVGGARVDGAGGAL